LLRTRSHTFARSPSWNSGSIARQDLGVTFSGGSGIPPRTPFAVPGTEGPEKPDKLAPILPADRPLGAITKEVCRSIIYLWR
jgi:hypothetical protein